MSLMDNLKIQEQRNRSLKKTFFVFYEGDEAEKSFVNNLKKAFKGLIITPFEFGMQISRTKLVDEFIRIVEDSGDVYDVSLDRIVYICDLDNVMETKQNKSNFLECNSNSAVDVYYTYPCIELLCFIYNSDVKFYGSMLKESIKSSKNTELESLNFKCFSNSRFSSVFLNHITTNNFATFVKNAENLIEFHENDKGEFLFENVDEKYVCNKIENIITKNINHTTLHQFIKVLQEIKES